MRIQPRRELLDVWRGVVRASLRHHGDPDSWMWGGADGSNSIGDAEQLLTLLWPATVFPAFALDRPDETQDDMLEALREIGSSIDVPRVLVRLTTSYMRRFLKPDGTPGFSGGTGYAPGGDATVAPTPEQLDCDVVESFATSVSLSLAALAFVRVFRASVSRASLRAELDELEVLASQRLSAAQVGLLRSFSIFVYSADSEAGARLIGMVNQGRRPRRQVQEELRRRLRDTVAGFQEIAVGSGQEAFFELSDESRLFECGWSWGVVEQAPEVMTTERVGAQPVGTATAWPYLYFTRLALDAIAELSSDRARLLGLLNDEQYRLSQALQRRWELTHSYWSTLATLDRNRWPIEDMPWLTADGDESDYHSLAIVSMMVSGPERPRFSEADLIRIGAVLHELASRGKITRRPARRDPAIQLHVPGLELTLQGSERLGKAPVTWHAPDYSPMLMTAALRVAENLRHTTERSRLLALADDVWEHMVARRHDHGRLEGLWDDPSRLFPELPRSPEAVSWHQTFRAVQCIAGATSAAQTTPPRSERLAEFAVDLLSEAEHVFDQELLHGSVAAGPTIRQHLSVARAKLQRAREIIESRPGTAAILLQEVLRDLDALAAARSDVTGAY